VTELDVPTLEGRHVYLRALIPSDHPLLQEMDTGGELAARWRFRGSTPSPERWAASTWGDTLAQFMVINRSDERPIGVVSIYDADLDEGYATIAAARFDSGGRSPAMMLGVGIFVRYVFACWDLRKLYMELPDYNLDQFASGIGRLFEVEGRRRDHLFYGGRLWDHVTLAIHREAWMRRPQARAPLT
jgi:hypothetical protein